MKWNVFFFYDLYHTITSCFLTVSTRPFLKSWFGDIQAEISAIALILYQMSWYAWLSIDLIWPVIDASYTHTHTRTHTDIYIYNFALTGIIWIDSGHTWIFMGVGGHCLLTSYQIWCLCHITLSSIPAAKIDSYAKRPLVGLSDLPNNMATIKCLVDCIEITRMYMLWVISQLQNPYEKPPATDLCEHSYTLTGEYWLNQIPLILSEAIVSGDRVTVRLVSDKWRKSQFKCGRPLPQCHMSRYNRLNTVYPKKYAHGFVVLCFVVVIQSFIMNSHEVYIHIHQGCFAGTGAIVRLPQCQWRKPDGYGKISQCITTTKHSKAKTVCIFLGIYCIQYCDWLGRPRYNGAVW